MLSAVYAQDNRLLMGAARSSGTNVVQIFGDRPVHGRATCRVLIANPQPIVRHGVRALLASEPDLDLVAETDDAAEALLLTRRLHPDVVLLDLLMAAPGAIA